MKFYVCEVCGNMVGIINESGIPMQCCGQDMTELVPGVIDGTSEKHIPVFSVDHGRVTVTVGSMEHPMTKDHYIAWIAIKTLKGAQRKELNPGEKPSTVFALTDDDTVIEVFAYCNIHGLWKAELESFETKGVAL